MISERIDEINHLAEYMQDLPQVDCPVKHRFAKGCYIREIFMPKGALVVGKIHATEHFNIILKGKCVVVTAEGRNEYEAPQTFVSGEGVQKVVYMLEDVVWQTVHVTDKTDPLEIEDEVIVENYDNLLVDSMIKRIKDGGVQ